MKTALYIVYCKHSGSLLIYLLSRNLFILKQALKYPNQNKFGILLYVICWLLGKKYLLKVLFHLVYKNKPLLWGFSFNVSLYGHLIPSFFNESSSAIPFRNLNALFLGPCFHLDYTRISFCFFFFIFSQRLEFQ